MMYLITTHTLQSSDSIGIYLNRSSNKHLDQPCAFDHSLQAAYRLNPGCRTVVVKPDKLSERREENNPEKHGGRK
jgi:hypothetical protein